MLLDTFIINIPHEYDTFIINIPHEYYDIN